MAIFHFFSNSKAGLRITFSLFVFVAFGFFANLNLTDKLQSSLEMVHDTVIIQEEIISHNMLVSEITRKSSFEKILVASKSELSQHGIFEENVSIENRNNRRIHITFNKTPYDKILKWLTSLKRDYLFRITQINISREDERGNVTAAMTIEAGR